MKKHFALIGHPITHSISPFIHERLFELSKVSAEYKLIDITLAQLPQYLHELRKLDGYNVTIPYKEKIVSSIDKLCDKAKLYGCVNTVKNSDCSCGYNTDAYGFLKALEVDGINLSGDITILGCGGAARVFCFEAVLAGCRVTLAVRKQSLPRALRLKNDVEIATGKVVNVTTLDNVSPNVDLLINATPVGMHPNCEQMPILLSQLENCKAVFDAIYNPNETMLIKQARRNGSHVASGLSMLLYQAVKAQEIWTGAMFAQGDICQLMADAKEFLKKFR